MSAEKRDKFFKLIFGSKNIFSIIPGLAIVIIITITAYYLNLFLKIFIPSGQNPISTIMLAIIIGIIIGNIVKIPKVFSPGINFCINKLLKFGIILMGIRLSIFELMRIAGVSVIIVFICISAGLVFTVFISNKIKLSPRLGMLIAAGSSICGASAIVALASGIEAEGSTASRHP